MAAASRPSLPETDSTAGIVVSDACSVPPWLLEKTFCIEYSPNCFKKWLVRLPGKSGVIDKRQYNLVEGRTGDRLGFGDTLEEAASVAVNSQNTKARDRREENSTEGKDA